MLGEEESNDEGEGVGQKGERDREEERRVQGEKTDNSQYHSAPSTIRNRSLSAGDMAVSGVCMHMHNTENTTYIVHSHDVYACYDVCSMYM